jgi:hypothetical protein
MLKGPRHIRADRRCPIRQRRMLRVDNEPEAGNSEMLASSSVEAAR